MSPSGPFVAIFAIFCFMTAFPYVAQESDEQADSEPLIVIDELEESATTVPDAIPRELSQRQPTTKDELAAAYEPEALAIVNEQLRREIELLARQYRDSESRNEIQLFGAGALVALIFLGIGYLIGKRIGSRRLL